MSAARVVDLYLKDFLQKSQPPADSPAVQPAGPPIHAIERFGLQPVADILIREERVCEACGLIHFITAGKIMRLFASAPGEPEKHVWRPRKKGEDPVELQCWHTLEIGVDHCENCWSPNSFMAVAMSIFPKKPEGLVLPVVIIGDKNTAPAVKQKKQGKYAEFAKKPLVQQLLEL